MRHPVETPLDYATAAAFLTTWLTAVCAFLYNLWEQRCMPRMESVFERGLVVVSTTRTMRAPDPAHLGRETVKTASGRVRFLSPSVCIFWPHARRLRAHARGFPLKGQIRFEGSLARIEARVPLGTSIFVAAFIVGFPIFMGLSVLAGHTPAADIFNLVLGEAFAIAILASNLGAERAYADTIVGEIEVYLAGAPA